MQLTIPRVFAIALVSMTGLSAFGSTEAAQIAPRFTGRWVCHWTNTTPRGLHNDIDFTLVIHPDGTGTRRWKNNLSVASPGGRKTLRIVQLCRSISAEMEGDALVIRYSVPQLLTPTAREMPSGLHLMTQPFSVSYEASGGRLRQVGKENIIFVRAE